jgi:enoyl-CoA hydratase
MAAPGVCRVTLDRPEQGNAQNTRMTYDINAALMRAAHDDAVRVIVLAGNGRHFSTGHDLKDLEHDAVVRERGPVGVYGDIDTGTIAGYYGWEREVYLDACRRWRSIPKPMIAEVQGACFGGGLMLAWVCDLIVASDDAFFSDPVVNIGANGVEFFAHAWELGARKAKEMLFTADRWSAQDAHDWGMVNHVVPRAGLTDFTLALATKIAAKPAFALKMVKESVNASIDAQGQTDAIDKAFLFHQLCHAHNRVEYGAIIDPNGLPETVRKAGGLSTLVAGPQG